MEHLRLNKLDSNMSLREKLHKEKEERGFISDVKLEKLITLNSIQEFLSGEAASQDELWKYVPGSRKLFAVLVLAGLERFAVECIINRGITDVIFPVRSSDDIPPLNRDEGDRFLKEQWAIAPILREGEHLDFHRGTVLPFLHKVFVDHGSFGRVYKVKIAEGHLRCSWPAYNAMSDIALKVIEVEDDAKLDTIMREVNALRSRRHSNLTPLLASFTEYTIESNFETKSVNMLFPYAEMDMEKLLYRPKPPVFLAYLTRSEQRRYLYTAINDLVSALAALHRDVEGLVASHHDLKPRNVLVMKDKFMIADLGMSELVYLGRAEGSEVGGTNGLGTSTYLPPEYYREDDWERTTVQVFGRAFDMWAMGCIMVQVAILIVWGWESGKVEEFRKERQIFILQQIHETGRDRNRFRDDDSFVKSIPVIDTWLAQLQEDGSVMLQGYLAITIQMLRRNPMERIYSWEAELDLYELLHPDESKEQCFKQTADLVQGPPPGKNFNYVETPIHRAAERGNVIRVINMLEVGWSAELKNSAGCTPIQLVERKGNFQLKNILLQANIIKESGWKSVLKGVLPSSVIHMSEQRGFRLKQEVALQRFDKQHHLEAPRYPGAKLLATKISLTDQKPQQIPLILKKDRSFGRTILHEVAQRGDVASLESLLENAEGNEALLLRDDVGKTPLHYASKISAEAVSIILRMVKDATQLLMAEDQNGRIPLHIAAEAGMVAVAEVLLHACPFKRDMRHMLNQEDQEGMTPLAVARESNNIQVAQTLESASQEHPQS